MEQWIVLGWKGSKPWESEQTFPTKQAAMKHIETIGGKGKFVSGKLLSTGKRYNAFLARKAIECKPVGFGWHDDNAKLFDFQRAVVKWAVSRGRSALFQECGMGKTFQQIAWADAVAKETSKPIIILTPLAVASQTLAEAHHFGYAARIVADAREVGPGINITNYHKLDRFDVAAFSGVVLDESSILKAFDGKTRTKIIEAFAQTPYKLACTATPAPNDHMELGNHAEFLGIMSRAEMLSMFFVHDGGDTSKWRLKGHAKKDFWRWVCSWAVNLRKPSDIGFSDDGFILPELKIHEHVIRTNAKMDGFLFALPASSLDERRKARAASLSERVAYCADLAVGDDQWIAWCNLNNESTRLSAALIGGEEVTGSDSEDNKAEAMVRFSAGDLRKLVTKPSICGFGMNWQNCHNVLYCGLSDSWEQFYQTVRRCWRFGQKQPVNCHIVISEMEQEVLRNIKRKQAEADKMFEAMTQEMGDLTREQILQAHHEQTEYSPNRSIQLPQWITQVDEPIDRAQLDHATG